MNRFYSLFLCLSALLLTGCATGGKVKSKEAEPFNAKTIPYRTTSISSDGGYGGTDDFYLNGNKRPWNGKGAKRKGDLSLPKRKSHSVISEILIKKSSRKMQLLKNGIIVKEYPISLGKSPVGKKVRQGDGKTPEGRYYIEFHKPNSQFYYGLKVSYPNKDDLMQARKMGVSAGGDIYIHGLPNKDPNYINFMKRDWTDGCIAVSNEQIMEIAKLVGTGTEVVIMP